MPFPPRYSRQILVEHFGPKGQESLLNAKVLVIGGGGLGCPILTYLASAGIGEIGIIDFDVIEESNLARQPLYTPPDIGKYKAQVASECLKRINPDCKVTAITEKLDHDNALAFISDYHIIADACDNFTTRYIINDACIKANKPWVLGSIQGWEGQVSVFNYKNGPAYRDLYPYQPADIDAPTCAEIGVIATLPAIIGSYQASEIIKCIIGAEKTLSGKLLIVDSFNNSHQVLNFKSNIELTNLNKMDMSSKSNTPVNEISFEEFKKHQNDYHLIDTRPEHEFDEFNIGGTNIPYHDLLANTAVLDKNKKYVLMCHAGKSSKALINHLKEKGFDNLSSLEGGLEAANTYIATHLGNQ